MGTSTPFTGLKGVNPLIPTWLPSPDMPELPPVQPDLQPQPDPQNPNQPPQPVTPPVPQPVQTQQPVPQQRFSAPKGCFTRFIRSGGQDRKNLGRGVSRYVSHSSGGSRTAARRMGSSRAAGQRLMGFLSSSRSQGAAQALRERNLGHLIGKPLTEVFLGLLDYICPDEGTIDAGIARDAFIDTIAELAQGGFTDLDNLTFDQMLTVFEIYATNTIEARLCNDLQLKTVVLPGSPQEIEQIQRQLHDFIRGGVSDAIAEVQGNSQSLTPDQVSQFVNATYEQAFAILKSLGDQEACKK